METPSTDDAIARLETELQESRIQPWEAETFLAKRHQAKFEALTNPRTNRLVRGWQIIKELVIMVCAYVGFCAILSAFVLWGMYGKLPFHKDFFEHDAEYHQSVEPLEP